MAEQKNSDQLELVDMSITKASADHIKSLFDGYFKEGKYGLEDAQKLVISINNVYKALDTLNKLQDLALRLKKNQEHAQLKAQSLAKSGNNVPEQPMPMQHAPRHPIPEQSPGQSMPGQIGQPQLQGNQVTGMPNVRV